MENRSQSQNEEKSSDASDLPETTTSSLRTVKPRSPSKRSRKKPPDLYSVPNVLRTESEADYVRLFADVARDFDLPNTILRFHVGDLAFYCWEMLRWRRIINGILDNSLPSAAETVLHQILIPRNAPAKYQIAGWRGTQALAHDWRLGFDEGRVLRLLHEAGTDESAIEAEGFRRTADQLEKAYRMLSAAEAGRDKALSSIIKYSKIFADRLRSIADSALAAGEKSSATEKTESWGGK